MQMQRSSKSELRRAYNGKIRTSPEIVVITGASAGLGAPRYGPLPGVERTLAWSPVAEMVWQEPVRKSRLWGARH